MELGKADVQYGARQGRCAVMTVFPFQNATAWRQYGWSLFKAMSHMLCIGYGQGPPQSILEVWVTIISMLLGATLYAMFIGHITNLIYSTTSSTRLYNEKVRRYPVCACVHACMHVCVYVCI